MKSLKSIPLLFLFIISSCQSSSYVTMPGPKTGVDFTSGKWLLNELDCPKNSRDKLTSESLDFFKKNLDERISYINDVNGLLITRKIHLDPNKTKLKELKDGTGFDYFINIVSTKNKSDLSSVELYQNLSDLGKNESAVILEIYDLNLQQIIFSQKVIGTTHKENTKSMWETKKSDKLIDNITFYKTSDKLMSGALKRIFRNLNKASVK
ncbi:hypothetical protein QWY99_16770 [Flavobacterium branchiarum]|uniref:Lipoprotein n=1 Tax=Flavobacterium branchiarum TaxID=1114870 RepID=A0ABV5FM68_9FLAO|nr:hypothetical protein [Flavobacterium branchiarum]MDN3674696.1 hypothetical protein [Flavobacterium branchiarum]